ncbi:aminotransferase class I/II-fold pyridoxal phosphate-dependent enzyme, partial [Bacillus velezensis]|uniref:aminotransferase class I/II-fold pyridoxal phosphate-dependent enzyme n=1 Tax=Bacillus velezensis TaxID=492670 RepID=UPI0012AFCCCF
VEELYKNMPADNILQTNGATGANMLAIYALVEAGDEVISMIPSYQQLYDIPRSLGAKVKLLNLDEKQDWSFKIDELK